MHMYKYIIIRLILLECAPNRVRCNSNLYAHYYLQLYKFEKKAVPQDLEKKEEFCVALSKYGVSLKQYESQLVTPKKKRGEDIAPAIRHSPRLHGNVDHEQLHNGTGVSRNLFGN